MWCGGCVVEWWFGGLGWWVGEMGGMLRRWWPLASGGWVEVCAPLVWS